MVRKIDLHIHTTCSDGVLTPIEVVEAAKANGVSTMAIADHDSIEAYTDEFFTTAKKNGIEVITAVEMSTRFFNVGFHVLGYGFDLKNERLLSTLSMLKNARKNYASQVAVLLGKLGYAIDIDALLQLTTVTKAHIALQIVGEEKNRDVLMQNFGHIPSMGEFIETVMNENCPAFVEKFSITPMMASEIIHGAGGRVVLAHPVAYTREDNITHAQILSLVKQMNADGIEAYYIYVDRNDNVIDEIHFWNEFAKKNNLIVTAGSDFHKVDGLRPNIGFVNTSLIIPEKEIDKILKSLK